ncbi:flavin reductase family protein [Alicyclobacillus cycloheptanicus]|uniref:Flavin reductase (DIM6/NTAB) family NADH-FMN oxidoreductase RutF n=1 Tax=Alicyclobacillus cycloheptanicus TaxID=1457 RepID=A0ABT9XL32_9BACL|nr:flavin reductase family protein [Alicyclobacillus cycloheptanicus]MDQ0191017.1 flavin reductase (DIM6/NTAB) family NADH-FMN oxidoreductase RutF [Alicyclobacillus cycloheptanicus]WDM00909.1 flavin reductase family protein [Alicyclobacillus cycloheptanicus]
MPVDAQTFRHALGHFASSVTVVTLADEGRKTGLTVTAFSSLSLNPPYILICIDKQTDSLDVLRRSQAFVVNFLAAGQADLSNHFASTHPDKFSGIDHHMGMLNIPILKDTVGWLECRLVQEVDGGDHIICIGLVEHASIDDQAEPLLYYTGKYRELKNMQ